MYVYGSVLVKDGNKHHRKTKKEKTKKMNEVEETKYVKDYLYSLLDHFREIYTEKIRKHTFIFQYKPTKHNTKVEYSIQFVVNIFLDAKHRSRV